ncbi:YetF domain-containing protein [Sporosarcina beigongshangi]|uniref:YetF domain-containing protein n=1 Tax=Sporosarcina beigongshangi TaxID=2782538 RepID=UPI00384F0610
MDELSKIHFWETLLRTTLAFIVLLIMARVMGKKQISQLTFFHYVTGITIGSIAAEIAGQNETPFVDGIIAMIWWALLTLLMSYIALKSRKARILLDDKPTIVMFEGKLIEDAMKKSRLHLSDLNMMLREQNIFSIKDVQYAILETNGNLSVLKKAGQEPATKKDVNAPAPEPKYIPSEIISDGKIVKKNLAELNLTEEWVYEQLKKQGIGKVEHVFYAEIQTDGSLHVDLGAKENK